MGIHLQGRRELFEGLVYNFLGALFPLPWHFPQIFPYKISVLCQKNKNISPEKTTSPSPQKIITGPQSQAAQGNLPLQPPPPPPPSRRPCTLVYKNLYKFSRLVRRRNIEVIPCMSLYKGPFKEPVILQI